MKKLKMGRAALPDTLVISRPILSSGTQGTRVSATLRAPGFSQELWYEVTGCVPAQDGTSFATAGLLLAMSRGWNLESEAPVSPMWFQATDQIQDIFQLWLPEFRRIEIKAATQSLHPQALSSGTFFSGGVDSYYTYLKHEQEISSLIFVTGFDIPLHKTALAQLVSTEMARTAKALNKQLIEVKTNLREFCDRFVEWRFYHGAALASVAHLLTQQVGSVFLAATHTYANLFPCGTHPLLDHLWGSETLKIIHDGCEANRFQKVARLAQSEVALQSLRVCYRNKADELNCGRCEKCLRTMVSLAAVGAMDRCNTFALPLHPRRVGQLRLGNQPRLLVYVQQNLNALQERQDQPHLVQALRQSMRRPGLFRRFRRKVKPLVRRSTYLKLLGRSADKKTD